MIFNNSKCNSANAHNFRNQAKSVGKFHILAPQNNDNYPTFLRLSCSGLPPLFFAELNPDYLHKIKISRQRQPIWLMS